MRRLSLLLVALACAGVGCRAGRPIASPTVWAHSADPPAQRPSRPLHLTDVTQAAGIRFHHETGASGRKWFPETNGSGAAIFDYDGDGLPDIFLINGRAWTAAECRAVGARPPKATRQTSSHLFRNRGDGTFADVTAGSGLDVPMYGMGCAAGDYDNDGDPDLYVTGVGRGWLFRNDGGGRFTEVARQAGVEGSGWGSSCAWVDYDRDGRLDLFVCHYVDWRAREDRPCSGAGDRPVYCGPNLYPPEPCRLYHQEPGGTFRDVSRAAGIWGRPGQPLTSKALGVALCDVDEDGWPDLAVANDTERNFLFRNNRNGTFSERGVAAGIALPDTGLARSGMGIDAGDWNGSGRESLLIGNFVDEMLALYRPEPPGLYEDAAEAAGIAQPSRPYTTFGCLYVDLNNDSWLDVVTANGHIDDKMERGQAVPLRQRPLVFLNEGGKRFREARLIDRSLVGRGLAAGDINRDGAVDLLFTSNGGSPLLLRNDGREGQSLRLALEGTRSNRSAIGAEVTVLLGSRAARRRVKSGSSYLSASELPLTIGIGTARTARVSIRWPSGAREDLGQLAAGNEYRIREQAGVTRVLPLGRAW